MSVEQIIDKYSKDFERLDKELNDIMYSMMFTDSPFSVQNAQEIKLKCLQSVAICMNNTPISCQTCLYCQFGTCTNDVVRYLLKHTLDTSDCSKFYCNYYKLNENRIINE
jgi:hypothetical protein